jgi:hypothetical protein
MPTPSRSARDALALGWLWLALAALIGAGLFSVLLVLSRAPYVKDAFRFADFFRVALIVHVDLSVLVWFGLRRHPVDPERPRACSSGWPRSPVRGGTLSWRAPFLKARADHEQLCAGARRPHFHGPLVFAAGARCWSARHAAAPRGTRPDGAAALRFGLNAAAVSAAVALIAFAWSWLELPKSLDGKAYYEVLFWGGGHVLQFTWTLLMFAAWLWLAEGIGARAPLSPRIAILLFGIGLASVFATPVIYLAYDVVSVEHYRMQTPG